MSILLADIGGTNARFRWLKKGKLGPLFSFRCDDYKTPYQVIEKVVLLSSEKLTGIVLAGAGPVQKGKLEWTNRPEWRVSENQLQKKFHIKKVLLVNDVQAQGEGLKTLYRCAGTSILLTAGTGLGGCIIMDRQVFPGEIGQLKIDGKMKIEDYISGSGIVRLYHSFGGIKTIHSARQIDVIRKKDKNARLAYQTFYQKWGEVSAQLATALCACGGVYLWGGLIPKNKKDMETLKKVYLKYLPKSLSKIHLHLVKDENLAFKGLSALSRCEFCQS